MSHNILTIISCLYVNLYVYQNVNLHVVVNILGVPDPTDKHGTSLPHRPGSTASILPPPEQGPQGWDTNSPYSSSMIHEHQHPNYIACFAAIVCIAALFLPTEGEDHFADYPYLQLTVNQKLVFAYVLGLVTMAILRAT